MLYVFFNFLHRNNFYSLLHSHLQIAIISVPANGVQMLNGVQSLTVTFSICFMGFHIFMCLPEQELREQQLNKTEQPRWCLH